MLSLRSVCAAALAAAIPTAAFIRSERTAGLPFFQRVPEAIAYRVHAGTAADLRNANGGVTITADSTPTGAALAAFATWNGVQGSRARFLSPTPQNDGTARADGVNLITFADSPSNRAIVFGAIAVTRMFSDSDGALTDTDVVFNPELPFSTTLDAGTFDIQGVLTHELGHALGMDHSGSATATMFATATRGSKRLRSLTEDDEAFLREVYPAQVPAAGSIEGVARSATGGVVPGATVTAFEPGRNRVVSAITDIDGRYRVPQLEPGAYGLIVEPLDGPLEVRHLSFTRRNAMTSFRTLVDGRSVAVVAGSAAVADLVVETVAPAYNIVGLSAARPGVEPTTRAGGVLERGLTYEIEVDGDGLDDPAITLASLRMLGTGIDILPTPLAKNRLQLTDGSDNPSLRFEVRVAQNAPLGVVSLALSTATGVVAFSAGLEIVDLEAAPVFTSDGVVNAATFTGGPVAPGSLVSLFGERLAEGESAGFVDPVSGRLVQLLGGVSVRLDGRPAAMLFASPGQINFQAPVDLPPGQVTVTLDRDGVGSEAERIEATSAAPGLFANARGGALALLLDGSLNGPERRVRRGEFVSLFGVGAGAVTPTLSVGELAPVAPLSTVEGLVQVEIGGRLAETTFAGMAPGFAGLLQINVRVPLDAPTGDAVPLLVRVNGVAAPLSSLSID